MQHQTLLVSTSEFLDWLSTSNSYDSHREYPLCSGETASPLYWNRALSIVLNSHTHTILLFCIAGFLVAQRLKRLPASARNVGDLGSIPGSGRSPGEGNGNPLQYSCLENPMGRGAGWALVRKANCMTEVTEHARIRNTDMWNSNQMSHSQWVKAVLWRLWLSGPSVF